MISPVSCAQCGQTLQLNQHFCSKCGAPVASSPQQPGMPVVPVVPVAQAHVAGAPVRKRRKRGWKRGLLVSLLLLLVVVTGAVLLALISYDRNVSIQDQARVLNTSRLQQTISDMLYDLNIITIRHFNGSTGDFTSQYSVNDVAMITIAVDVENRFLAIK
jgi:zinc-ribbon domain